MSEKQHFKPNLTAIPKPWERPVHPVYPQRVQVLVIVFLISLWLHILCFGLWQASSWRLELMDDHLTFEPPVLELTLNLIPEDASETLAALEKQPEPKLPELPPLHEDLNQTTAQAAAFGDETLKSLLEASLPAPPAVEAALPSADEALNMLAEPPPEMKKYSTATKAKIRQKWVIPPDAYKGGVYVAEITIDKQGTLTRIITKTSSGEPVLDHAAMEAIKAASPFDSFPAAMAGLSQYSYEVVFNYDVKKVPAKTARAQAARPKNGRKKQRR